MKTTKIVLLSLACISGISCKVSYPEKSTSPQNTQTTQQPEPAKDGVSTAPSADATKSPVASSSAVANRLNEVFTNFTPEICGSSYSGCNWKLMKLAGLDGTANPRALTANPSPKWIPGWQQLSPEKNATRAQMIFARAAANRFWSNQCDRSYEKYSEKLDARMAVVKQKLAKIADEKSVYVRLAALVAMSESSRYDKYQHGTSSSFSQGLDAVQYEIARATVEAFHEAGLYWLFDYSRLGTGLEKHLMPRPPKKLERELYCFVASEGAISEMDKLPNFGTSSEPSAVIRHPFDKELAKLAQEKGEQFMEEMKKLFPEMGFSNTRLPGKLKHYKGEITSINKLATGFEIVIQKNNKNRVPNMSKCRKPRARERFDAFIHCQVVVVQHIETITALFSDLPKSPLLKNGATVHFFAIPKNTTHKESKRKTDTKISLDGRHLYSVHHGGKSTYYFKHR